MITERRRQDRRWLVAATDRGGTRATVVLGVDGFRVDDCALLAQLLERCSLLCAALAAPSKLLSRVTMRPQTALAKITSGADPVQLAMDAIELAQGGSLNEATAAGLLGDSLRRIGL